MWNKFEYLGYDKETILKCRSMIDIDNVKTVKDVSVLLIFIISILLIFYSIFDSHNITRLVICIASTLFLLSIQFASKIMLEKEQRCTTINTNIIINLLFLSCFIVAIYLGTFAVIDEMAVAPVWMFFFAILIFNRYPFQNLIVLIISGGAFLICSFILKRPYLFEYDAIHAITSIIASIYVSWVKTRLKVENVLTLMKLQKENHEILETVEEKEKETEILRYKVAIDELTGFYKKRSFEDIVANTLKKSHTQQHVLICCDLDDFKNINDKFGHMFGDDVIREIVNNIVQSMPINCIFGRFGGDEFMVFIENIDNPITVLETVKKMQKQCEKEYRKNDIYQKISLSSGCAFYPLEGQTYNQLFESADEKLYQAKTLKKTKR